MPDISFLQFIGSIGGVGGVFAVILFWVYWLTVKQIRQDRKFMEDRLTQVLRDYNDSCRDNQKIIAEHNRVLTELMTWLKARNGKKD